MFPTNRFATPLPYVLLLVFLPLLPYTAQAQSDTIPDPFLLTPQGYRPAEDGSHSQPLDELTEGQAYDVFAAPPCLSGDYWVAFQLAYNLPGHRDTEVDWSVNLRVSLLHNDAVLWTKPLRVNSRQQIVYSTAFHDTPLTCGEGYRLRIERKVASEEAPVEHVKLEYKLFPVSQGAFTGSEATISADTDGNSVQFTINDASNLTLAYDIEWVHYDEYETGVGASVGSDDFTRKAPVRVTVTDPVYRLPLFYPTGTLAARARPVGVNPAYPEHRIYGAWRYISDVVKLYNPALSKNWQTQTVFAEEGKHKRSVGYRDGTQRVRQTLTNLSSQNFTLMGETRYDYEGRPSVQVMPVPLPGTTLTYRENVNRFTADESSVGEHTSAIRHKFHYDNTVLPNSTLTEASGAGRYYSPSNDLTVNAVVDRLMPYVPQAYGYAYSQTQYTNDPTGRVAIQSGVGKAFRSDGGRPTRYFYAGAAPEELVRLFGSNVGNARHFRKQAVVDPNGQVSVTYLDQEERTVATALVGEVPNNLAALSSHEELDPTPVTVKLSIDSPTQQHTLLNVSPNTEYTFRYQLSALAAQVESFGCQECAYDLFITLTKPDGTAHDLSGVTDNEATDGSFALYDITAASCSSPTAKDISFTATLEEVGDYTLMKRLVPQELNFERAKTIVAQRESVQDKIATLTESYTVDESECVVCREGCSDAEEAINEAITEVSGRECEAILQQINAELSEGEDAETHPRYCEYELCVQDQGSKAFDRQLSRMEGWGAATTNAYPTAMMQGDDPFFAEGSSGAGQWGAMNSRLQNITAGTVNGQTYAGALDAITDPDNTAMYVDESGNQSATGKHLLYYDLMDQRTTLGEEAYQQQLDAQRWRLFKSLYTEQKRQIKLALPAYQNCGAAYAEETQVDELPTDEEGIQQWGEGRGVYEPVSAVELQFTVTSIEKACDISMDDADRVAVNGHLEDYFAEDPNNIFRFIFTKDIDNPNLTAVENILSGYNCSLTSVAIEDPFVCGEERQVVVYNSPGASPSATASPNQSVASDPSREPVAISELIPMLLASADIPYPSPSNSSTDEGVVPDAIEYQILKKLYNVAGGSQWNTKTRWFLDTLDQPCDPCGSAAYAYWQGVGVADGDIVELDLKILSGTIPSDIGGLTKLRKLSLEGDQNLIGRIPDQIGDLSELSLLRLTGNFDDPIPELLFNLLFLEVLEIEGVAPPRQTQTYSNIKALPSQIGKLQNLKKLVFNNHKLATHILPSSLGSLSKLEHLELRRNNLLGPIPSSIASISSLEYVDLRSNPLLFKELQPFYSGPNNPLPSTILYDGRGLGLDASATEGDDLTISYDILTDAAGDPDRATLNQYQWFELDPTNGSEATPIPGAVNRDLTIENILRSPYVNSQFDGFRFYELVVTNAWVTDTDIEITYFVEVTPVDEQSTHTICVGYQPPADNPTLASFNFEVDWDTQFEQCMDRAQRERDFTVQYATARLIEREASTFYQNFRTNCLAQASETLEYTFVPKEHHYTLYYYDQSAQLVQTVPPEGVKPLNTSQVASVLSGSTIEPGHSLRTTYRYNSLNQLTEQQTPDAGQSTFHYDRFGQLRLSQNAEQAKSDRYSYTKYDAQGRTTEVGELTTTGTLSGLLANLDNPTFPNAATSQGILTLNHITRTYYDTADVRVASFFPQTSLRNRVAWTAVEDTQGAPLTTHYAYDAHGNVRSLLQTLPGLGAKRTDYVYDLVSGNVRFVLYQADSADQFCQEYRYDADNRLTEVYTSTDRFVWQREAQYHYYPHGPLARVVLGEHTGVQGQDYYYTLQGWLKGVNGTTDDNDPSGDGLATSPVGRDAFAFSLGYHQGDYAGTGTTPTEHSLWDRLQEQHSHQGLYNGNIAWMQTSLPGLRYRKSLTDTLGVGTNADDQSPQQAMLYHYDQLNRLVQAQSLQNYNPTTGFAARSNQAQAYDVDYAYDANGNLTSLLRHDQAGQVRNDFTYAYYDGTNKLRNLRGNTKDHYRYDAIGNLVAHKDKTQLSWTPYGKVEQVNATDENATTTYRYDAAGNRVAKQTVVGDTTLSTFYARDASGNVLAIYQGGGNCRWTLKARLQYSPTKKRKQGRLSLDEPTTFTVPGSLPLTQGAAGKGRAVLFYTDTTGTEQSLIYRGEKATQLSEFTFRKSSSGTLSAGQRFVATALRLRIQSADSVGADTTEVKLKLQGICNLQLTEQAIYGSSRLGAYQGGSTPGQQRLGLRRYELSNHLGNVLAVVSDNIHLTQDSAWATVISTKDYYPFGLTMRERRYRTRQYRYAFNGKEQDKDFGSVSGTIYDYGFRVYDPKVGKFLSVDPLTKSYPWYTPYQFAGDNPIKFIDLDGLEEYDPQNDPFFIPKLLVTTFFDVKHSAENLILNKFVPTDPGKKWLATYKFDENGNQIFETVIGQVPKQGVVAETVDRSLDIVNVFTAGKIDPTDALGAKNNSKTQLTRSVRKFLDPSEFNQLPVEGTIDPNKIRFSQDDISRNFRNNEGTVKDVIDGLGDGSIDPLSIEPIRIVEKNGKIFTLDNRRLKAFQEAGVRIPFKKLDAIPKKEKFKFTTKNEGVSIKYKDEK